MVVPTPRPIPALPKHPTPRYIRRAPSAWRSMTPYHHSSGSDQRPDAREPRVAILVLGCRLTVYEHCIRTIRATWGSKSVENADIFYVYGGQGAGAGANADMVGLERLIGRSAPALADGQAWVVGDVILCGAADVREDQADCILRKRLIALATWRSSGPTISCTRSARPATSTSMA